MFESEHRFRDTFSKKEGVRSTKTMQVRVLNTNSRNFTVDVISTFDPKPLYHIQWSSPYLHPHSGEGLYAIPEPGCLGQLVIPGDGSSPYLSGFVAPLEVRPSSEGAPTDASFAAGRQPGNPGDIVARGRDGNGVIVHRGGVVEIFTPSLARRLMFPVGARILEMCRTYELQTPAGALEWTVRADGPDKPGTYSQVFRINAASAHADLRVSVGTIAPLREPEEAIREAQDDLGMNPEEDPPVKEVVLSLQGFAGFLPKEPDLDLTYRAVITRAGRVHFRAADVLAYSRNRMVLQAEESLRLKSKSIALESDEGIKLLSQKVLELEAKVIRMNGGGKPAAGLGDMVLLPAPGATVGMIVSGNFSVLLLWPSTSWERSRSGS